MRSTAQKHYYAESRHMAGDAVDLATQTNSKESYVALRDAGIKEGACSEPDTVQCTSKNGVIFQTQAWAPARIILCWLRAAEAVFLLRSWLRRTPIGYSPIAKLGYVANHKRLLGHILRVENLNFAETGFRSRQLILSHQLKSVLLNSDFGSLG